MVASQGEANLSNETNKIRLKLTSCHILFYRRIGCVVCIYTDSFFFLSKSHLYSYRKKEGTGHPSSNNGPGSFRFTSFKYTRENITLVLPVTDK